VNLLKKLHQNKRKQKKYFSKIFQQKKENKRNIFLKGSSNERF
jgi:hypothetical protein